MTKTMGIIAQSTVGFILACGVITAQSNEREAHQAEVQAQVVAESAQVRAGVKESMKIQLRGLEESGCSRKPSFEASSVIVMGVDQYGPTYFSDSLYEISFSKFQAMKPGQVWALLYCN